MLVQGDIRDQYEVEDFTDHTPLDRIKDATGVVFENAIDPRWRGVAANILKPCRNVKREGPRCIADWIRKNITYLQESPGVELLQGPRPTYENRVGDCDDLAILFATLCRAAGLKGHFVAVARYDRPEAPHHAVGYCEETKRHYELSMDGRYGGVGNKSSLFDTPKNCVTLLWAPQNDTWYFARPGEGYQPTEETMLNGRTYLHRSSMGTASNPWLASAHTRPKVVTTDTGDGRDVGDRILEYGEHALDWYNAIDDEGRQPPPPSATSFPAEQYMDPGATSGGPGVGTIVVVAGLGLVGVFLLAKAAGKR